MKRSTRTVNSYQEIPTTTFSCAAQVPCLLSLHIHNRMLCFQESAGIFADQETGCQVCKSEMGDIQFEQRMRISNCRFSTTACTTTCRFSTTASLADASTPSSAPILPSSTSSTLCVTGETFSFVFFLSVKCLPKWFVYQVDL